jgi:Family of unknown function (DUF6886)
VTDLWHFSEDPSLGRFVPRDGKVWAIDEPHSWLYWFPRDCPRACFWATGTTTEDDVEQWLDGDLLARHAEAGNELRISPSLYPLWDRVIETSLDFSGIRLRNAARP